MASHAAAASTRDTDAVPTSKKQKMSARLRMQRRLCEKIGKGIYDWTPPESFITAQHREGIDWRTAWLVGCVVSQRFVVTRFVGGGSDGFGWAATVSMTPPMSSFAAVPPVGWLGLPW